MKDVTRVLLTLTLLISSWTLVQHQRKLQQVKK